MKFKIEMPKSKILLLGAVLAILVAVLLPIPDSRIPLPSFAQITRNADQVLNAVFDTTRVALLYEYQPGTNTELNAVAATATQTSTTYTLSEYFKTAELYITWSGITGTPAGCTIQPKASGDGTTFINSGTAISVTPSTNAISVFTGATGTSVQYTYACTTYPTGGTLTLKTVYKQ